MPWLSRLTWLKPSKPSGANPSPPGHEVIWQSTPAQRFFFEEYITEGDKHRGNYFIARTKQTRDGNRTARKGLLAEKEPNLLNSLSLRQSQLKRRCDSGILDIPAYGAYGDHRGCQGAVALFWISEIDINASLSKIQCAAGAEGFPIHYALPFMPCHKSIKIKLKAY